MLRFSESDGKLKRTLPTGQCLDPVFVDDSLFQNAQAAIDMLLFNRDLANAARRGGNGRADRLCHSKSLVPLHLRPTEEDPSIK